MPRAPRLVVPGVPHHVTQRGNRRQTTFFKSWDYELYKQLLSEECARAGLEIWAYCLLPNHVHLIAVPSTATALARAMGRAHRAYTVIVNRRESWRGCLWQGRFASYPMDERHLLAATRYLLLNPTRAGLVTSSLDWPHSSLQAHLSGVGDGLAEPAPLGRRIERWSEVLGGTLALNEVVQIRRHTSSGLPLGGEDFLLLLERQTGRRLREPISRSAAER